jgi:GTPase SAR1 family protein|eukprot:m.134363 g.134363  ORF g.134363 m.134363 type:complete len:185 (+) comp22528_c0_seq15:194-748(+)
MLAYLAGVLSSLVQAMGLSQRRKEVLVCGLDNAGKTTLLYMLMHDRHQPWPVDAHTNPFSCVLDGVAVTKQDLGGMGNYMIGLRRYLLDHVAAVLFVVDACDAGRLDEARELLHQLRIPPALPCAVQCNKMDLDKALSKDKVAAALRLDQLQLHTVRVFGCSVVRREGYQEPIRWLVESLGEAQ